MSNIYISCDAEEALTDYLVSCGHTVIKVETTNLVYGAVAAHPDIYMCKLGAEPEAPVYKGDKERLGFRYPQNIIYNAAVCGKYFIHNLKYTDAGLLEAAGNYIEQKDGGRAENCSINEAENRRESGSESNAEKGDAGAMIKVHTAQGYTKCNIAVVDGSHIITEDEGVFRAVSEKTDIKVLLISPKQVKLNGFAYGFIGGASGRIGNEMIFSGDVTKHSDYAKIRSFIEECGLDIKYFDYPLTDIGSIIEEKI